MIFVAYVKFRLGGCYCGAIMFADYVEFCLNVAIVGNNQACP